MFFYFRVRLCQAGYPIFEAPFSNLPVRGFEAALFAVATDFANAIVGFAEAMTIVFCCKSFGGIAQLVERLVRNEKARGSNPLTSKYFSKSNLRK